MSEPRMTDYERNAINEYVEPVLMALALGATYEALIKDPREEEPFATEDDVLPDEPESEEAMFWPDGAKTRKHELEESW